MESIIPSVLIISQRLLITNSPSMTDFNIEDLVKVKLHFISHIAFDSHKNYDIRKSVIVTFVDSCYRSYHNVSLLTNICFNINDIEVGI